MNISELIASYNNSNASLEKNKEEIKQLKEIIKQLQDRITDLQEMNSWINMIIKPIAHKITQELNFSEWELIGPFGPNNQICIRFYPKNLSTETFSTTKSITFQPFSDGTNLKIFIFDNDTLTDITNLSIKDISQGVR